MFDGQGPVWCCVTGRMRVKWEQNQWCDLFLLIGLFNEFEFYARYEVSVVLASLLEVWTVGGIIPKDSHWVLVGRESLEGVKEFEKTF